MCGIAGLLDLTATRRADPLVVDRMTAALAHRGPDDGSVVITDGPVALGHRRLAVLDLSREGRQPMMTTEGAHGAQRVITYNGEVYNHQTLRRELEATGHTFKSRTDTEVVLHAVAEWGIDFAVRRLNGMFAFAVWDGRRRELALARDRYGQKPLYYAVVGDKFLFASEVKALCASGLLPGGIDEEALLEYLTFQNTFGQRTLFSGVKLLPAGHTLTVRPGEAPKVERYWDFDFRPDPNLTDEREVAGEVRRLLEQAVRRQLVADVDVGAFLSGGIDSASIVALAARMVPRLRTFTCGFDLSSASGIELAQDERAQAELVSFEHGTEHYEVVLKAGDLERAMPALARAVEEPRVGQSYPNYYVAGLAAKFGKVALSGVGGDELFGGYPWRYAENLVHWQERLLPEQDSARLLAPIWKQRRSPREVCGQVLVTPTMERYIEADPIDRALHFEAKTFLHGLLVVEDKLAMAHGLEVRFPFLDNDLVDFAQRIPSRMKVRDGVGKYVLRDAVRSLLPRRIVDAPKRGFSAPDGSWFRGPSLTYVFRELLGPESRIRAYVDSAVLKEFLEEHVAGEVNRRLLIWSLLSVEHFLRTYA